MTFGSRIGGDDGMTLVELLTGLAVSAVVLTFVTGTVIDALRSQRRETAQLSALVDQIGPAKPFHFPLEV